MKKKILGLSVLVGSAMLAGCIDPSKDNSSVLQNALKFSTSNTISEYVGIIETDIPSFENSAGNNPTDVTVTFSGGAEAARTAGCLLQDAADQNITTGVTSTSQSLSVSVDPGRPYDSMLGGLYCNNASVGTYTADIQISFTAGGKNYSAKTTLTATKS